MHVREFNNLGSEQFKRFIYQFREDQTIKPPLELLEDDNKTKVLDKRVTVELKDFKNRWELGVHLNKVLEKLDKEEVAANEYLWEWLTLFYFEIIRLGGKEYHKFVPQIRTEKQLKRHKLFLPWFVVANKQTQFDFLFLDPDTPIFTHNDITEKVFTYNKLSQYLCCLGVIKKLYFYPVKINGQEVFKTKSKIVKKEYDGSALRLREHVERLDIIRDVSEMTPDELIDTLPAEFDHFKSHEKKNDLRKKSPSWTVEEVTIALDFYMKNRKRIHRLTVKDHEELSKELRDLNICRINLDENKIYRNVNSIGIKLGNFAFLDPKYAGKGLLGRSTTDEKIWKKYINKIDELGKNAEEIRKKYGK